MSFGGSDMGGGSLGAEARRPLPGVRLSMNLWLAYQRVAQNPAYIEDRRVGHEQAAMLLRAFDQPLVVSIVDAQDTVRASSGTVGPIFTRSGATLIIGDAAKPKLKVLEPGTPDALWRLVVRADDNSTLSGSFGLWGADAAFVWGRTVLSDTQSFGFKRSLIMTQLQVAVQPPDATGDFLYCIDTITGPV